MLCIIASRLNYGFENINENALNIKFVKRIQYYQLLKILFNIHSEPYFLLQKSSEKISASPIQTQQCRPPFAS
jgi:hypothetical protein